jgi:hypothetical protein
MPGDYVEHHVQPEVLRAVVVGNMLDATATGNNRLVHIVFQP